jgi:hypothetical protein
MRIHTNTLSLCHPPPPALIALGCINWRWLFGNLSLKITVALVFTILICMTIQCSSFTKFNPVLRIPDSGSWFLSIPDPGSKNSSEREGGKNLLSHPFLNQKYNKIKNCFIFELLKKKIWANLQRILELLTQKIAPKNLGFGILDPDPQHWFNHVSWLSLNFGVLEKHQKIIR